MPFDSFSLVDAGRTRTYTRMLAAGGGAEKEGGETEDSMAESIVKWVEVEIDHKRLPATVLRQSESRTTVHSETNGPTQQPQRKKVSMRPWRTFLLTVCVRVSCSVRQLFLLFWFGRENSKPSQNGEPLEWTIHAHNHSQAVSRHGEDGIGTANCLVSI